ncbi:hypothetical protein [Rhodopseudomonas palustris]|uniref:hypothetical protein n=1 Tax=Rhodopseudomonas palustris TaxID=1076 RepID=UPI001402072E|nr:hypothetical protein [Rhodopseudomonas palustris]
MSTDLSPDTRRKSAFRILVALNAATLLAWIGFLVIGLGAWLQNVVTVVWLFLFG